MGSYDGAEVCELVGSYILSHLAPLCDNQVGLYHDDGIALLKASPRDIENTKKAFHGLFRRFNLKITIDPGTKIINFLDVTLDLTNQSYRPYHKPNTDTKYVNSQSNHPPAIIKNIPIAVNQRLNKISSNEASFNAAAEHYQTALQQSGYSHRLQYVPNQQNQSQARKRSRNREVLYFHPPYSQNVTTRIGREFLNIVDTCFHRMHPLKRLFNRHTLKISYSCSPNFQSILNSHNRKIMNLQQPEPTRPCNCRSKPNCPLAGKCLEKGIVYQATITRQDNNHKETYVGITGDEFKTRYNNHTQTFRNSNLRNTTQLSKYIWGLKDSQIPYELSWSILKKRSPYNLKSRKCNLCLYEKYLILCKPHLCSLNRRSEAVAVCRHRKRFKLKKQ